MFNRSMKGLLAISLLLMLLVVAGCGGSSPSIQRIMGLTAEETVQTFFDATKNNRIKEAALYVSAVSQTTAQTEVAQIKKSNLLSVKQVAEQGNYAVVIATMQEQNTFKMTVKPVGLEKVNGEWYIIDLDQIYIDAKYKVLQQLLANL